MVPLEMAGGPSGKWRVRSAVPPQVAAEPGRRRRGAPVFLLASLLALIVVSTSTLLFTATRGRLLRADVSGPRGGASSPSHFDRKLRLRREAFLRQRGGAQSEEENVVLTALNASSVLRLVNLEEQWLLLLLLPCAISQPLLSLRARGVDPAASLPLACIYSPGLARAELAPLLGLSAAHRVAHVRCALPRDPHDPGSPVSLALLGWSLPSSAGPTVTNGLHAKPEVKGDGEDDARRTAPRALWEGGKRGGGGNDEGEQVLRYLSSCAESWLLSGPCAGKEVRSSARSLHSVGTGRRALLTSMDGDPDPGDEDFAQAAAKPKRRRKRWKRRGRNGRRQRRTRASPGASFLLGHEALNQELGSLGDSSGHTPGGTEAAHGSTTEPSSGLGSVLEQQHGPSDVWPLPSEAEVGLTHEKSFDAQRLVLEAVAQPEGVVLFAPGLNWASEDDFTCAFGPTFPSPQNRTSVGPAWKATALYTEPSSSYTVLCPRPPWDIIQKWISAVLGAPQGGIYGPLDLTPGGLSGLRNSLRKNEAELIETNKEGAGSVEGASGSRWDDWIVPVTLEDTWGPLPSVAFYRPLLPVPPAWRTALPSTGCAARSNETARRIMVEVPSAGGRMSAGQTEGIGEGRGGGGVAEDGSPFESTPRAGYETSLGAASASGVHGLESLANKGLEGGGPPGHADGEKTYPEDGLAEGVPAMGSAEGDAVLGLNATGARKARLGRREFRLCACTVAWNIAQFLPEWALYHAWMGVDHFFVYDNNSDDDLARAAFRLSTTLKRATRRKQNGSGSNAASAEGAGGAARGPGPRGPNYEKWTERGTRVSMCVRSWPWLKTQQAAFAHCMLNAAQRCEWVMFIDVDEFLFPVDLGRLRSWTHLEKEREERGPFLQSWIQQTQDTSCPRRLGRIAARSLSFGPSGQRGVPPTGMATGYKCRLHGRGEAKVILRPEYTTLGVENWVHGFKSNGLYEPEAQGGPKALLFHYKYQAWDEYKTKFVRRVAANVQNWKERDPSQERGDGVVLVNGEPIPPKDWTLRFCQARDARLAKFMHAVFGQRKGLRLTLPWETHNDRDGSGCFPLGTCAPR